MVNANSSAVFHNDDEKKKREFYHREIIKILEESPGMPLTSKEISKRSETQFDAWKRMSELVEKGRVNSPFSRSCNVTGRKVQVWALSL